MIKLENIQKKYNENKANECYALKGIDLTIEDGEMVAVTGKSGSGKSTLLHILGLLDYPTDGSYFLDNMEVGKLSNQSLAKMRNQKIGFVMQDFALIPDLSVSDNILLPVMFNPMKLKTAVQKAEKLMRELDIGDFSKKPVNQLSGGQKQRVAIARALLNSPKILLADEPTGALDSANGRQCMELLRDINKKGTTIVIVTHDDAIASYCERIIRMRDGKAEA